MWRRVSIILVILQLYGRQAIAHEPVEGKIHAAVGPYLMHALPYHHEFASPFNGGIGILAEGDIDNHGGIEIGMFYFPQYFSITRDNSEFTERAHRVYITMGYRHWFSERFSAALAFFSSYAIGEAEQIHNDFGGSPPFTSAHDMTEYGFDASVQYEFWHVERFSLLVDARYSYSLTPKSGEDQNFIAVLAALKYFVQGQQGHEEH